MLRTVKVIFLKEEYLALFFKRENDGSKIIVGAK